jgi:beta-lactamase superfamily II metal-dependent hydrolase
MADIKFIGYPEATLFDKNPEQPGKKKVLKKVLWGDLVELKSGNSLTYQEVKCRGASGWIAKNELQEERLLEVNFIDVGQGDGVFIVTPDDKNILIDSGAGDNMYNFLSWRFNLRYNNDVIPIENIIITHSDLDHYGGFRYLINSKRFKINNMFHNGIMERTGKDKLGKIDKIDNEKYITEVFETKSDVLKLIEITSNRGTMTYPNMLFSATESGIDKLDLLDKGSYIPGYAASDKICFEILGPVPVLSAKTDNRKWLKFFDNDEGKAKNGNSVVMMLKFGNIKIFIGGDLNEFSERYLSEHYTGFDPLTTIGAARNVMVEKGRSVFGCDVAKSCHHGSHHFLDDFLKFIYPSATVISSGDNETYTHPRPETLGAIGKASKGERPLIFSTELARSAKDKIELKENDLKKLSELKAAMNSAIDKTTKDRLEKEREELKSKMERAVAVYGMINLRTDGKKIILAQKKEETGAGFEIFKLEPDNNGNLRYTP